MNILISLFLTFAKIGIVGFGGGMAILALIYQSMLQFNNMDPDEFSELFAISQATPGPLAINAATFSWDLKLRDLRELSPPLWASYCRLLFSW